MRNVLIASSVKMVAIRMQFTLYLVLLLNIYNSFVSALYFHIGETEKKCFTEEIPDETMVIGNYRMQLYDKQKEEYLPATQGLGVFVEVKDPDEKVILSRQYGSEGKFILTSHTPGEHQICFHSNSSKLALFAGGMLHVHLDIKVGESTNNYTEIAAKDKLTELQLRVRQLKELVDQIYKEQNYQRYREERFKQTNESTNQRILWWSVFQLLILIIATEKSNQLVNAHNKSNNLPGHYQQDDGEKDQNAGLLLQQNKKTKMLENKQYSFFLHVINQTTYQRIISNTNKKEAGQNCHDVTSLPPKITEHNTNPLQDVYSQKALCSTTTESASVSSS